MKTRIMVFGFAGVLLLSLMMAGIASAAEVKNYVFGSGPMGGPWRIGIGAGVQVLNEQLKDKYSFTAAASGGSVENVRRMMGGEYHLSWVHVNNMYDAWNGVGLFEGQKPFKDLRVLAYLVDQAINIATLAKLPIKNLSDLAGKKVNIGPAGSGGIPIAKAIFKAIGIADKVKIVNVSFEAGAQALKDGQIDVSMIPGGPYVSPSIVEISRSATIRIVEPTPEEAKKVESEVSYLYLGVIPPNKSVGEGADKEKKALFWSLYWIAVASMPDEVVYDILKVTQEPKNKEVLGKVVSYWITTGPEFSSLVKVGVPIHPGAVKFWKEKGAKIPAELIK
jgi:TRAP transporter TAXI family solute receptor